MNCRKSLYCSGICFVLFLILILLVKTVGVDAIGPQGTEVGLAKINGFFSERIVYNDTFYKITELLGYLAILICAAFGAFGLYQIIKLLTRTFLYSELSILRLLQYMYFLKK